MAIHARRNPESTYVTAITHVNGNKVFKVIYETRSGQNQDLVLYRGDHGAAEMRERQPRCGSLAFF